MPAERIDLVQASLLGEALDRGPLLVFVADESMRYLAVNQLACETLGYTREELLGLRVDDIAVAPEAPDLYEQMLREANQRGRTELRRKDGSVVLFNYWARETTTAGMTFWVSAGYVE
ncbi:MAG: PAS domain S-box protein [Gaiellaceae bacterium]